MVAIVSSKRQSSKLLFFFFFGSKDFAVLFLFECFFYGAFFYFVLRCAALSHISACYIEQCVNDKRFFPHSLQKKKKMVQVVLRQGGVGVLMLVYLDFGGSFFLFLILLVI